MHTGYQNLEGGTCLCIACQIAEIVKIEKVSPEEAEKLIKKDERLDPIYLSDYIWGEDPICCEDCDCELT